MMKNPLVRLLSRRIGYPGRFGTGAGVARRGADPVPVLRGMMAYSLLGRGTCAWRIRGRRLEWEGGGTWGTVLREASDRLP